MTRVLPDPESAARWAREAGPDLGLVPTMGALHEGHLELVRRSTAESARTVVSVFVNPLQFDRRDDFERYPRDFEGDVALLRGAGCDAVFTGTLAQFFPGAGGDPARIPLEDPGPAAAGLEGEHRPGHFAGVATIVRRLFELVRPRAAYFGEKDFQQTLVVRDLARRLGFPRVAVVPTVREPSGLARSSRNALLADDERREAEALSRGLFAARRAFAAGVRDAQELAALLRGEIEASRLRLEYAELRDPVEWARGPLEGTVARAQALAAARIGRVRLIDNLRLDAGA